MQLAEAIAELRSRNEVVPTPPQLPTPEEVTTIEAELGVSFHPDYRTFLLEASDVTLGCLEPATITLFDHTHLPSVVRGAWQDGVPNNLLAICEDNADFYCISPDGEVVFWSHNGPTNESWPSLGDWIRQVWIEQG